VKKPRKKKEKKQPNYARLCKFWGSITAILATVCILLGGVIYLTITRYQQEREDLKARAAAVKLRENQADKRDAQIADLQKKLDEAYRQIAELQTEK
jgi:predicted RNase H-like nuclease (RuvC/YqgF family)